MPKNTLPDTIQAIIQQIGTGLRGGFVYVGGHNLRHRCEEQHGEYRSAYRAAFDAELQDVKFDVGLQFEVNGKTNEDWIVVVSYEPDDTYAVFLTRRVTPRKPQRAVIDERHDVYGDELQEAIEKMYDAAIEKFNGGFINLG